MFNNFAADYHPPYKNTLAERIGQLLESRFGAACHINQVVPVHAQDITDNAVISFKNNTMMARRVDRQYDKLWGQTGAKRGTTINLRYPAQYALRRGDRAQPQGSNETFFPVTLGTPTGVDMDFTSQELLLTVDNFVNRFVKKAALPIVNGVDSDLAGLYKKVNTFAPGGIPGTIPTDIESYIAATTQLAQNGAPVEGDEWTMMIDYKSNQKIIKALAGQYNPQSRISEQWETARMTDAVGYMWGQDQNIKIHTIGALGGTPVVDGAGQSGNSINFRGATANVNNYWNEGDIVQFAGSKAVKANSVGLDGSYDDTGDLAMFVCSAAVNSDANGKGSIPISPKMTVVPNVPTGDALPVSASPADGAAITTFGAVNTYAATATRQNLAFNKGAFVLGMVDLPLPGGMDMAARTTDEDTAISIRFLRGFDITENQFISRLDCLYVVACPRPQFACRVVG